jgi:hypothetical protein
MLGRLAVTGRVCGVGPEHVGLGRSGVNFGPRAGATASPAVTRGGDITPGPLDDSKATSAPPRRCFRAGSGFAKAWLGKPCPPGRQAGPARIHARRLAYDGIVGKRKDPAAVKLGRRGGLKRMAMLTPQQRADLARRAALARWRRAKAER